MKYSMTKEDKRSPRSWVKGGHWPCPKSRYLLYRAVTAQGQASHHSLMSGAGINERGGSMSLAEKALIKENVLVHIDTFWNKCLHFPLPTFQFSGQERS